MQTTPAPRSLTGWRWLLTLSVAALPLVCGGCQTFSLSEGDFQKQQRGEYVDPATGRAVTILGTAGYFGAILGSAVAAATGK